MPFKAIYCHHHKVLSFWGDFFSAKRKGIAALLHALLLQDLVRRFWLLCWKFW